MTRKFSAIYKESLRVARVLMVLSSISPLFILWAIRGNCLIPDKWFIGFCLFMVVIPNGFLWLRIQVAKRRRDTRKITVGMADDHRDHILVYLFAIMLPFYSEAIETWRNFGATLAALAFIVFLFWHLNLHYMNILFAVFNYRVYTISPPLDGNPLSGGVKQALITRRASISPGENLIAYRLSDTVYLEVEP